MSSINSNWDYSSLFGSLSTGSSNGLNSINLSDYATIKSGAYSKLLKSYYGQQKSTDKATGKNPAVADSVTQTNQVRSDVANLKKSLEPLYETGKNSLFNKVTKKGEDGKETSDYDYERIYSAVKTFTDNYNALVKSAGDSDNTSILRNARDMVQYTAVGSRLLANAGITINSDNTLSVSKDDIKAGSISALKSLFQGNGSYGNSVDAYATRIEGYAVSAAKQNGTYTKTGSYDTVSGSLKNGSIFDDYL